MPFTEEEEEYEWIAEEERIDAMAVAWYVILTQSDEDDSCCMVVSCKWGDDYEPDDTWCNNPDDDLWSLYQDVDIQWAYRDSSMEQPNWVSRTATVLLPR